VRIPSGLPLLALTSVCSHLLPSSSSLRSSLPCSAAAGGPWSWAGCYHRAHDRKAIGLSPSPRRPGTQPSTGWVDPAASKVCCKFFRNKNPLLLSNNEFGFFCFSSFSSFFSPSPPTFSRSKESDRENNDFLSFCWKKKHKKIFHQDRNFFCFVLGFFFPVRFRSHFLI